MTDIVAMERSIRTALPAGQEIAAGDWVIRISGGPTKRINSANPVTAGARLEEVKAPAEALYAAHALPPRFRLTPLADALADAALAAAGYTVVDRSLTMLGESVAGPLDPARSIRR